MVANAGISKPRASLLDGAHRNSITSGGRTIDIVDSFSGRVGPHHGDKRPGGIFVLSACGEADDLAGSRRANHRRRF
jgi:hypothetical protein